MIAQALKPLRVLLIEDNDDDEQLVVLELRRSGYDVRHQRVETADAMRLALDGEPWDIVISDYSLPQFSAPSALAVLKQSGHDLPFIICSGTIGEEVAVEALHAGAHDFLVKSRLARLAPAIEREMGDARARRARRDAEEDVKRLQAQVQQNHKMEAIGRLAGGVAHDFNNILTAIIATADLALEAPGVPDEVKQDLSEIRDAGRRAALITRQLLTFSRQQVVQPRAVDASDIVQRTLPMLTRLVTHAVRFETDLTSTWLVEADPTQVEQVLLNLVVNASDAMPADGVLSIATRDVTSPAAAPSNDSGKGAGDYVQIRVRDTGIGMDQGTMAQIFEPFFTTKGPGRGTGLGLATVYGIVNQAQGHIDVQSEVGRGTTFDILLPRAADGVARTTGEHATSRPLAGSEVVLVVEDEATVRAPICRALRHMGYCVLEATNGEDALRVLHDHHAPIHLLVSDVIMPAMGGAELVLMLHDWYPHLKVLFISGFSEELVQSRGGLSTGASYLAKPFTADELLHRVRDVLDERVAPVVSPDPRRQAEG